MSINAIKYVNRKFDREQLESCTHDIIFDLYPEWKCDGCNLDISTFSDGITNTVGHVFP